MASPLGTDNPIRYRGYVYDQETGLYYLQSRYYDPEMGRFINADNYPTTGQGFTGNNMFSYCGNNPVSRADDCGEFWNIIISAAAGAVFGAVVGAAAELTSQAIKYVTTGEKINWGDVATSAAGGAVYGGVIAATGSKTAASMASTATTTVIDGVRNGDSAQEILVNTAKNTLVSGAVSIAPKMINKSLSGKYVKLNKIESMVKKWTSPYQGKYASGPNYLADSFDYSVKKARNTVFSTAGECAVEFASQFIPAFK